MEKIDIVIRIAEVLGAAIAAGWISRVLTIRQRVRQESANADKAEAEVKSDQIENIEKMVEKAYKPIIEDLTRQIKALQEKVEKLEAEKDAQDERIDELVAENRALRRLVSEVRPDVVLPSKRSENAKKQARGDKGQFVKKEDLP